MDENPPWLRKAPDYVAGSSYMVGIHQGFNHEQDGSQWKKTEKKTCVAIQDGAPQL